MPTRKKLTPKKARKKRYTGSGDWSVAFLAHLRGSANVKASCAKAKVSRPVVYARKKTDSAFAAAWEDALEDATDDLEAAARKRAIKRSDTLLIFLLKAHRPAVYRDKLEVTHRDENPLRKASREHLERLAGLLGEIDSAAAVAPGDRGGTAAPGPGAPLPLEPPLPFPPLPE